MPHSLRVRLGRMRYKGIITDKDYQRLCKALDMEKVVDDIKAEFTSLYPKNVYGGLELDGRSCVFSLNKVFEILDKHISP